MQFKTERIQNEFSLISPFLRGILFEADYFSTTQFNKEIVITHLLRTQEEQNDIYKDKISQGFYVLKSGKKYYSLNKKYPTISVHQVGRGADLRTSIYLPHEIELLCAHIRHYFPYNNRLKSCIVHNIGHGNHFHIQTLTGGNYDYSKYL